MSSVKKAGSPTSDLIGINEVMEHGMDPKAILAYVYQAWGGYENFVAYLKQTADEAKPGSNTKAMIMTNLLKLALMTFDGQGGDADTLERLLEIQSDQEQSLSKLDEEN